MKNNLVIVDAGHGGIDSGAVSGDLVEKDLNLKASQYIFNRLQELGIPTKMTRVDDSYLPKEDRINKVLSLYDNNPNTILIANHINAGGGEGAEVVYALRNDSTLADMVLENIGKKGQIKRKAYQRRLPENPNKDYYYILRETKNIEPILIEYGFIDNPKDSKKLKNNLLDYAEGVVEAIANYTNYNYYPPTSMNEYIVKGGDTLYKIANNYNTTVDTIKEYNGLTNNILSIGQVLKIPSIGNDDYEIYVVQKGDSLWKISKEYNIPVNKLIEINNLSDLTIKIGQEILVPSKMYSNYYIVKSGDTLWSIANNNNISVSELKQKNNLTSNLLSIGQKLII